MIRTYADVDLILLVGVHREVASCQYGFDMTICSIAELLFARLRECLEDVL